MYYIYEIFLAIEAAKMDIPHSDYACNYSLLHPVLGLLCIKSIPISFYIFFEEISVWENPFAYFFLIQIYQT